MAAKPPIRFNIRPRPRRARRIVLAVLAAVLVIVGVAYIGIEHLFVPDIPEPRTAPRHTITKPKAGLPRVYLLVPLSGPFREEGHMLRQGVELAWEALQEQGIAVELAVRDGAKDEAGTTQFIRELAEDPDVLLIIGHLPVSVFARVIHILEEKKLPLMVPASSHELLAGRSWVFPLIPSDRTEGGIAATIAANWAGRQSIAAIREPGPYGKLLVEDFAEECRNNQVPFMVATCSVDAAGAPAPGGGPIQAGDSAPADNPVAADDPAPADESSPDGRPAPADQRVQAAEPGLCGAASLGDLQTLADSAPQALDLAISEVLRSDPAVIWLAGSPPWGARVIERLSQQSYQGRLLAPQSYGRLFMEEFFTADAARLSVLRPVVMTDPASGELKDFRRAFRQHRWRDPDWLAVLGYDAIGMVGKRLRQGAPTRISVREHLLRYNSPEAAYHGVGGDVYFDANGRVHRPLHVTVFQDGSFVAAKDDP